MPSSSRPWTRLSRRPTGACVERRLATNAISISAYDVLTRHSVPESTCTSTPPMGARRRTNSPRPQSDHTASSRTTAEPSRSIVMVSLSASPQIAACTRHRRGRHCGRVRPPRMTLPTRSPRVLSMPSNDYSGIGLWRTELRSSSSSGRTKTNPLGQRVHTSPRS